MRYSHVAQGVRRSDINGCAACAAVRGGGWRQENGTSPQCSWALLSCAPSLIPLSSANNSNARHCQASGAQTVLASCQLTLKPSLVSEVKSSFLASIAELTLGWLFCSPHSAVKYCTSEGDANCSPGLQDDCGPCVPYFSLLRLLNTLFLQSLFEVIVSHKILET